MSERDLQTVLHHINTDVAFAALVMGDARYDRGHMRSWTLDLYVQQHRLHLTDSEAERAINHARAPLAAAAGPASPPVHPAVDFRRGPCANLQDRIVQLRTEIEQQWVRAGAVGVRAGAAGVRARQTPPAAGQAGVFIAGILNAAIEGYIEGSALARKRHELRRAFTALEECLRQNRLHAEADRLSTTSAAIDAELAQVEARAGVA